MHVQLNNEDDFNDESSSESELERSEATIWKTIGDSFGGKEPTPHQLRIVNNALERLGCKKDFLVGKVIRDAKPDVKMCHFVEAPPGIGKTTCCCAVARSMRLLFVNVKVILVFPSEYLA